jgi:hypothetical protein
MRILGQVIGGLVVLGTALALLAPRLVVPLEGPMLTHAGLYAIGAVRIALGFFFRRAARVSRAPGAIKVLGVFMILAGIATPLVGVARAHALLDWWMGAGVWSLRLVAVAAMALGGFLIYAFRPPAAVSRP